MQSKQQINTKINTFSEYLHDVIDDYKENEKNLQNELNTIKSQNRHLLERLSTELAQKDEYTEKLTKKWRELVVDYKLLGDRYNGAQRIIETMNDTFEKLLRRGIDGKK